MNLTSVGGAADGMGDRDHASLVGPPSRVDALERRLTQLRAKLAELRDSVTVEAPSKEAVRSAEEAVRDAMLHGTPGQRKALLKELIVEVRVESRDSIIPTFRLPATSVRVTETVVGRRGLEPCLRDKWL
jgi:site-specific DNA recombinase